jgi:hypothetical protein
METVRGILKICPVNLRRQNLFLLNKCFQGIIIIIYMYCDKNINIAICNIFTVSGITNFTRSDFVLIADWKLMQWESRLYDFSTELYVYIYCVGLTLAS